MKKLMIFRENDDFVVERVNEFNHGTKRFFASEEALLEGLQDCESIIADYELHIIPELWSTVINFLNSDKVSGAVKEKLDKVYVKKQVELTLSQAKEILFKIDSAVDKLEGEGIHKAMIEIQDLLLDWNLLGHNFANMGIQDWIESEE